MRLIYAHTRLISIVSKPIKVVVVVIVVVVFVKKKIRSESNNYPCPKTLGLKVLDQNNFGSNKLGPKKCWSKIFF